MLGKQGVTLTMVMLVNYHDDACWITMMMI